MIGLAIGDALSWPAMFHRSYLLPPWTRRILREIHGASETTNVLALPMPFSLNRPATLFDVSATDDTEWAAFTAGVLLECDPDHFGDSVVRAWMKIARSGETIRGSVGTQAALRNLRRGVVPPRSGKENPHYFDDGAIPRSVPIGVMCVGDPDEAARMTSIDASVTNSEDGVWAAQGMAAAVSLACAGSSIAEVLSGALQCLPGSSWIRRAVDRALGLAGRGKSIFSTLPQLTNTTINREYSYGNVAPETLALTFVVAKSLAHDFERAVTMAAGFPKSADGVPAFVGALVGAMHSEPIASDDWLRAVEVLKGICIPSLAGTSFLTITEKLVERAVKHCSPSG